MTFRIIIEDRALKEAQEAYDYYEKQQEGLGERFRLELEKSINHLTVNPKLYRKIKKEIRQKLLYKFPFVIVYEIMTESIIIYAVFHQKRNPRKKLK